MFYTGQGVPQDLAVAVTWYRKAAEQGDAAGQHGLGFLYDKGQGVPLVRCLKYPIGSLISAVTLTSKNASTASAAVTQMDWVAVPPMPWPW